jgi:hypothetical protein
MKGAVIAGLAAMFTAVGAALATPAHAGDVRVGISIGLPVPAHIVVEPSVVYAPAPVVYAPAPSVHYSYPYWYGYGKAHRWKGAHEFHRRSRHVHIPPGHLPPPGECRVWLPGLPPGHQPPPGRC